MRIQKVLSEGDLTYTTFFFFFFFFLVNEGREDPSTTNSGSSSLACRWWPDIECWLGRFVIFGGSRPVLLRNPIFVLFFKRGPGPLPNPPSLDSAHVTFARALSVSLQSTCRMWGHCSSVNRVTNRLRFRILLSTCYCVLEPDTKHFFNPGKRPGVIESILIGT